eukprot:9485669-Pyramimonas_sp.AAC.1
MGTSTSNRSPLRVHFSSQANVATFPLWTIQRSPRARSRARTRARGEFLIIHDGKGCHVVLAAKKSPQRWPAKFRV